VAQAAPPSAAAQVPAVSGEPASNENSPTRAAKFAGSTSCRKPRTGHTEGSTSTSAFAGSSATHSVQAEARKST
jgi:hypothetical protein